MNAINLVLRGVEWPLRKLWPRLFHSKEDVWSGRDGHPMNGRLIHCLDCDAPQPLIALDVALVCHACGSRAWTYRQVVSIGVMNASKAQRHATQKRNQSTGH